ncbi:MAG: tetratricopeptide repeat protein [Bacteroidales bacterium]
MTRLPDGEQPVIKKQQGGALIIHSCFMPGMPKCIHVLLLVFIFHLGYGQAGKVDSLLNALPDENIQNKINIYIELSDLHIHTNEDSSQKFGMRALEMADSIGSEDQLALARFQLGKLYYHKDSLDRALHYLLQALPVFEERKDSTRLFNIYNYLGYTYFEKSDFTNALKYQNRSFNIEKEISSKEDMISRLSDIGMVYEYTGDYDKALAYYNQAMKLLRETNDKEGLGNMLNNLGNIYYNWNNYERSLDYYLESLSIYEALDDQRGIAVINNNIGIVYHDWGQYDKALEYYEKGLEIEKILENKRGIAQSLINIGIIYADKDEYEKAYEHYRRSIEMAEELNDKVSLAIALSNMGDYYVQTGEFDKALKSHKRSIRLDEEMGNMISVGASYSMLGDLYKKMGDYRQALDYYFKSNEIIRPQKLILNMAENYKGISESYANLGNYKKAYEYHLQYYDINDSLFNESMARKLNMLQTGYEIKSREQEIELLNQEKDKKELQLQIKQQQLKRQHLIGIGFIAAFALFTLLSLLLFKQYRQKKSALENLEKQHREIKRKREELIIAKEKAEESDQLKSAFLVNLSHEIRTPINGIVGFSNILEKNKTSPEEKKEYLAGIYSNTQQLLNLINNIIDISSIETGQISIHKTKTDLQSMIKEVCEEARAERANLNKTHIDFQLKMDADMEYKYINTDAGRLKQILQNLIYNAFKYTNEGRVVLSCWNEHGNIRFSVSDSGIGIPKDKFGIIFDKFRQLDHSSTRQYGGTGLGLSISRELLKLMGGKIWLESETGKGSTFYVEIPAH